MATKQERIDVLKKRIERRIEETNMLLKNDAEAMEYGRAAGWQGQASGLKIALNLVEQTMEQCTDKDIKDWIKFYSKNDE